MEFNLKVIITKEDDLYYVGIPNLTVFSDNTIDYYSTYGETVEEALKNAKEIAVLHINDLLNENKRFEPKEEPSELKNNQFVSYIFFNLEYELAQIKQVLKNKTVVIPVWLDILAQKQKINFSQVLQNALKKELKLN